eukprot:6947428-Pyramimonas_sp.AAC.1
MAGGAWKRALTPRRPQKILRAPLFLSPKKVMRPLGAVVHVGIPPAASELRKVAHLAGGRSRTAPMCGFIGALASQTLPNPPSSSLMAIPNSLK